MFCGECGTKNEKGAQFCEKCGAKLEVEETKKTTSTKTNKQPMKKQTKLIIGLVSGFVVLLIALFVIGSSLTKPEHIVKSYMEARVKQDYSKLYDYMVDVKSGDKTFVSKQAFINVAKENDKTKVINYTVGNMVYDLGKLTGTVKVNYTLEGSSSTKEDDVKLKKSDKKSFLVFDKWVLAGTQTESTLVKDFEIKVPTKSKVVFNGIKVTNSYLNKDKSSSSYDVYVLPQVFNIKSKIKTTLKSGMVIEDTYTPSEYYKTYTARLSSSSISESFKKTLVNQSKTDLKSLYEGVLNNTEFDKLNNKNFDSELSTSYSSYLSSLSTSSRKLTKFDITKVEYYSVSTTSDGYIRLGLKINYDYTVSYKTGDVEETKDKSSYDYVYLTYDISGKNYKLREVSSLPTYFSIY